MKHLLRKITIVLMVLGIIVVVGCKKEDNVKAEDVNIGLDKFTIWQGGKNCTFKYEDEDYEVYLWSRIALGGKNAEFRLEGLPEGTINKNGGIANGCLTFGDNQYVPYVVDGNYMNIKLNSSIVSNPTDKTKALFEQNEDTISLRLIYSGDSVFFK